MNKLANKLIIIGLVLAVIALAIGKFNIFNVIDPLRSEENSNYVRKIMEISGNTQDFSFVSANTNIRIIQSNSNIVRLTYYEHKDYDIILKSDEQKFEYIEESKNIKKFFNFSFNFFVGEMTLELPETIINSIKIDNTNGNINISDVSIKDIDIKTTNAKIFLKQIISENMQIKTTNAKISLEDIESKNKLSITTTNGKVAFSDILSKDINIKTTNGSINGELDDGERFSHEYKTTNGKVIVNGVKYDNRYSNEEKNENKIVLTTTNGSITVDD